MSIELITIKELLRDPQYRSYFTKVPKLPPHYTEANLPWKLIILKSGEKAWRSKRFGTYQDAFAGLKKMLPVIQNGAINCPALTFMPPTRTVRLKGQYDKKGRQVIRTIMWKPSISSDMEHHDWCSHCRRPSIFKYATTPPRQRGKYWSPQGEPALRCIICGASDRIVNLRHPENEQRWDTNRAKVTI